MKPFDKMPLEEQLDHIQQCQRNGLEEICKGSPAYLADIADHLDLWGPWLIAKVRELVKEREALNAVADAARVCGYDHKTASIYGFDQLNDALANLTKVRGEK